MFFKKIRSNEFNELLKGQSALMISIDALASKLKNIEMQMAFLEEKVLKKIRNIKEDIKSDDTTNNWAGFNA